MKTNSLRWLGGPQLVRRLQHRGRQNGPYGRLLQEVFGFDELSVEDFFSRSHLPKVDIYEEYLFMVLV